MSVKQFCTYMSLLSTLFSLQHWTTLGSGFGARELEDLRTEVRDLMLDNQLGLSEDNGMLGPLDTFFSFELPLVASSVRLVFHDCTGEYPTQCNGCIDLDSRGNIGLYEGSIGPLSDICIFYNDYYQLSIADCWALSATFALELSGELSALDWVQINDLLGGNLASDDIPPAVVTAGTIGYYVGRMDCTTSPMVQNGTYEEFPRPTDSWHDIQTYFKTRFPHMSLKEVVALISGGHSLGRAHSVFGGSAGPRDMSPNTLDNEYHKALLGENRLGPDFNWQFGQLADENVLNARAPQFFVDGDFTQYGETNDPFYQDKAFLMFESDVSLAFDLSASANCMTDAEEYCADNYPGQVVLMAGETWQGHENETCPEVQCPLQCQGGAQEYNSYLINSFDGMDNDYNGCPVAWIKQFADDIDEFAEVFKSAFTKLITAGYDVEIDRRGVSLSESDDIEETDLPPLRKIELQFGSYSSFAGSV